MSATAAEKKLLHTLTQAIEKWMEEECDENEWNAVVDLLGNDTASFMADAAFAVFLSAADVVGTSVEQGFLTRADD